MSPIIIIRILAGCVEIGNCIYNSNLHLWTIYYLFIKTNSISSYPLTQKHKILEMRKWVEYLKYQIYTLKSFLNKKKGLIFEISWWKSISKLIYPQESGLVLDNKSGLNHQENKKDSRDKKEIDINFDYVSLLYGIYFFYTWYFV